MRDTINKKQIRVAIYTRVSTREQALEGYSLDAQERTLKEYCIARKFDIVDVYRDEGISAAEIDTRPELLRLLENAKEKKFDIILVWKLTRFMRRLSKLASVCEELEKYNIALVSYSESFDCSSASGKLVRNMLGVVAEFEREVISENVSLGLYERARRGKPTCTQILGYDKASKDLFVPNKKEAEYVQFVFRKYLELKNLSEVAKLCRERGYTGKRGKSPTPQSVLVILTRPFYCGFNSFRDINYCGMHEAIVDIETFNKVQSLLKKQGRIVGRQRIVQLHNLKKP